MAEKRALRCMATQLLKLSEFVASYPKTSSVTGLEVRLDGLADLVRDFTVEKNRLFPLVRENELEELELMCEKFFNDYLDVKAGLVTKIKSMQPPVKVESPNLNSSFVIPPDHIRLPTIPLPSFAGEYDKWSDFRQQFDAIVKNNDKLSDNEKLNYLRSCLTGDAKRDYGESESSFVLLWGALVKVFENKQWLVSKHLRDIFQIQSMNSHSAEGLNSIILCIQRHLRSLRAIGLELDDFSNAFLIEFVLMKVDAETSKDWQLLLRQRSSEDTKKLPTWDEFTEFITSRVRMLQQIGLSLESNELQSQSKIRSQSNKSSGRQNSNPVNHVVSKRDSSRKLLCYICQTSHLLSNCPAYMQMSSEDKLKTVNRLKLCRNCLSNRHNATQCPSKSTCRHCKKPHHSTLHTGPISGNSTPSTEPKSDVNLEQSTSCSLNHLAAPVSSLSPLPKTNLQSPPKKAGPGEGFAGHAVEKALLSHTTVPKHQILLNTAEIWINSVRGKPTKVRALLDSGAMSNFMTQKCATLLGIKPKRTKAQFSGICGSSYAVKDLLSVVMANQSMSYSSPLECLVVEQITSDLPLTGFSYADWPVPEGMDLADSGFNMPAPIDVLIGNEHLGDIFLGRTHKLGEGLPKLELTVFGWVVGGRVDAPNASSPVSCLVTNEQLDERLRLFWEDPEDPDFQSDAVIAMEDWFVRTHYRTKTGRYGVRLPFKKDKSQLGDSRSIALKRFRMLEGRLSKNSDLRSGYVSFMDQYLDLGHMEDFGRLKDLPPSTVEYFIPHHPVFRPDSTTTPLRVVFDGSATPKNGISLNNAVDIGHIVQSPLIDIVLRFRFRRYALTADVPKMYRQILVAPEDRNFQQILWRPDSTSDIHVFRLNTVTYGTSCAPYLATRTLKQLCLDSSTTHPKASSEGLRDFYVDDLLTGADDPTELTELMTQFIDMMHSGGFDLHKISSNYINLLAGEAAGQQQEKYITEDSQIKTLGITWQPKADKFIVSAKDIDFATGHPTKRTVFSDSAKLFDPIGLIGPVTVTAKCLMQNMWRVKDLDWDMPLPEDVHRTWTDFSTKLQNMPDIEFTRCVLPMERTSSIQLIGFCDASQKAYGAAVYIRSVTRDQITCHLLCSKSRIAPLNNSTIPRLELSSLLLLAQLIKSVKSALPFEITDTLLFSDSTIAIAWAKTDVDRLKMYVANRVQKIRKLVDVSNLLHIDTRKNAADVISRGLMPDEIHSCQMWFHGPAFLMTEMSSWPVIAPVVGFAELPEVKPALVAVKEVPAVFILFERVSRFRKMVRIMRRAHQFIQLKVAPKLVLSTMEIEPTVEDLQTALRTLIRLVQSEAFPETMRQLKSGHVCTDKVLLKLKPRLDKHGIMRVDGRLKNASLTFVSKHQAILPPFHPFTTALIRAYHQENAHAGPNLTLATLQREFWIVNGKNAVRKVTRSCVPCFRVSPKTANQLMGDLPSYRVNQDHISPFLKVGVDYAGPVYIKQRNKRSTVEHKGYICLFVCTAVKAVHLELVGDLTTASFLAALDRFIARRGKPELIISDNGTNFVGAKSELDDLHNLFVNDAHRNAIQGFCATKSIEWKFIPPRSPNFGGLWESAVKSVKFHLKRIIGPTKHDYEELYTILCQIEGILNSRPITPATNDPRDLEPLTPGHFLIFRPMNAVPRTDFTERKETTLDRWTRTTKIVQHFWDRWHLEYLNTLQGRYKWHTDVQVSLGQMVVIKEDNIPPQHWSLGRIVTLVHGADGLVRVVDVLTKSGILRRPLRRLCFLPIMDNNVKAEETTFHRPGE